MAHPLRSPGGASPATGWYFIVLPSRSSLPRFAPRLPATNLYPHSRLHLPLNLRRPPRSPFALQIIKVLQVQQEFRVRLEIPGCRSKLIRPLSRRVHHRQYPNLFPLDPVTHNKRSAGNNQLPCSRDTTLAARHRMPRQYVHRFPNMIHDFSRSGAIFGRDIFVGPHQFFRRGCRPSDNHLREATSSGPSSESSFSLRHAPQIFLLSRRAAPWPSAWRDTR